jgi:hypothetical protein
MATPALAQLGVGIGGQGGVNVGGNIGVGVNPGSTIGTVNGTLDRTVTGVDRSVNRTVDRTMDRELRAATSADLTAGATVRDNRGHKVGAVQSVSGGAAVVVRNGRTVHVPLASLYRSTSGLVTSLSQAQLDAMASANASAGARVRY